MVLWPLGEGNENGQVVSESWPNDQDVEECDYCHLESAALYQIIQ